MCCYPVSWHSTAEKHRVYEPSQDDVRDDVALDFETVALGFEIIALGLETRDSEAMGTAVGAFETRDLGFENIDREVELHDYPAAVVIEDDVGPSLGGVLMTAVV